MRARASEHQEKHEGDRISQGQRLILRSRFFPWQGKTFEHESATRGHGINRLFGERVNWFRFETSVGPSNAGDFDAVHLDYSHDRNPPVVRDVKDEVSEVAPGLWMGLDYL